MSIHFVSGKPGGGKSLYGLKLITDEIIHGTRHIVTNVPLKLGRLNQYLQEHYPHAYQRRFCPEFQADPSADTIQLKKPAVHITDAITILTEDELPKFFTFRANDVRLQSVNNQEWRQGKRPDFSQVKDNGVFYVLDEVHIAFNSRAWADTGSEVLYYLSQHRKLGDDVVCITQAIGNVDKQFRSVAQDFTYIKNLSKQRAGMFRLPSIFLRSTYAQPATDNSKAMESGTFRLDVTGLASCYDTAKGVGIHGRAGADMNHRKKGIHWLWFVVCLPLVLVLVLHYLPLVFVHVLSPAKPKQQSANVQPAAKRMETLQSENENKKAPRINQDASVYNSTEPSSAELPVVVCVGVTQTPSRIIAFLSDGRTADSDEGEIQAYDKHKVRAFGTEFKLVPNYPKYTVENRVTPTEVLPADQPPALYRDNVQVTVIGDSYANRRPPQSHSGFASMAQNQRPPIQQPPNVVQNVLSSQ